MTFSDRRVADAINKSYVAAWVNRGPGFRDLQFHAEKRIFEGDLEAYPTKNICTFFLTPEGKVFYYVAGSYAPEIFLSVLETADALRKAGPEDAPKIHRRKAEDYAALRRRASDAGATSHGWRDLLGKSSGPATVYRGLRHKHSARCAWSLAQGYAYFATLHRALAEWSEPKDLDAVRYAYLYGNEFTEESADATAIARAEGPESPPAAAAEEEEKKKGPDMDIFDLGLLRGLRR